MSGSAEARPSRAGDYVFVGSRRRSNRLGHVLRPDDPGRAQPLLRPSRRMLRSELVPGLSRRRGASGHPHSPGTPPSRLNGGSAKRPDPGAILERSCSRQLDTDLRPNTWSHPSTGFSGAAGCPKVMSIGCGEGISKRRCIPMSWLYPGGQNLPSSSFHRRLRPRAHHPP